MHICFIILHYRNIEETVSCIDSILRMHESSQMQILVVDNSPDDNSGQEVKERYCDCKNVCLIPSEENAGFSRANNIAYKYALEHYNPDFIVASNNDIVFLQEDFKRRLEIIYQQTHFAVLGPDVVHAVTGGHQSPIDLRLRTEKEAQDTIKKNRLALKVSGVFYPLLNLILSGMYENKENMLPIDYQKQHQKVVLLGACLIFSKEFLKHCDKAFYPETDFFYEEYILASRCEQLNLSMVYDPTLRVQHESGAAIRQSHRGRKKKLQFILSNTMKGCQVYLDYIRNQKNPIAK